MRAALSCPKFSLPRLLANLGPSPVPSDLRNTQLAPELDVACTLCFVTKQTLTEVLMLAYDWRLSQSVSVFDEVHGKLTFVQKGQNLALVNRMTFTL